MATSELGTAKTVVVLAIVVGCFAVLWPKIFYPMLQASINPAGVQEDVEECCEVLFSKDVEAMGVVKGVCEEALRRHEELQSGTGLKPQQLMTIAQKVVRVCKEDVLSTCGVDITVLMVGSLHSTVPISKRYIETLHEIRSDFNATACLRKHFGLDPSLIGGPRRMRTRVETPHHMRPERPPHLRPDIMHPALREKGRAIPQRTLDKEAKPGPMPGMRPPIGGPGHVVPAPKGSGTMGIVMPLYTVGIVIFFVYTIMKVLFKKQDDPKDRDFPLDSEQRKYTYTEDYHEGEYAYRDYVTRKDRPTTTKRSKTTCENGQSKIEQKRGDIHSNHEAKNGIDVEVPRKPTDTLGRPLGDITLPADECLSLEALEWETEEDDLSPSDDYVPPLGMPQERDLLNCGKKERDARDIEIDQLRRRLEETEATMERIVAQMGSVSDGLSPSLVAEMLQEAHEATGVNVDKGLIQAVDQERDRISEEQLSKDSEKEDSPKKDHADHVSSTRSSKLRLSTEEEVGDTSDTSELHTAHDELRKMGGSAEWVDDLEDEEVIDLPAEDKPGVSVVGFEMSAKLDGGRRWTPSPPTSPTPPPVLIRPHTPSITRESPVQSIILEGALPTSTRLLVSDTYSTEELSGDQLDESEYDSAPVVLSGKVTLSVLGMELVASCSCCDDLTTASSLYSAAEDSPKGNSARSQLRMFAKRGDHGTREAALPKESSKASSPDMEEYEVIGQGTPQEAGSPISVKSDSFEHMNGAGDEVSEKTQYITATAAIPDEGTTGAATGNLTGTEETAADVSAMDALGDIDDQQDDHSRAAEELPADSSSEVRQRMGASDEEEEEAEEEEAAARGQQPTAQPGMSTSSSLESANFELIPGAPVCSSDSLMREEKEEE